MTVHVSEITFDQARALAANLRPAAERWGVRHFVVSIDDAPALRDRSAFVKTIIDQARLRGDDNSVNEKCLCTGDLRMDRRRHEVTRAGHVIHLSPMEYALLEYLLVHRDRALTEELLIRSIFGETPKNGSRNTLWVHIHRLRRKIDREPSVRLIHTIKRVGYILKSPRQAHRIRISF